MFLLLLAVAVEVALLEVVVELVALFLFLLILFRLVKFLKLLSVRVARLQMRKMPEIREEIARLETLRLSEVAEEELLLIPGRGSMVYLEEAAAVVPASRQLGLLVGEHPIKDKMEVHAA
jgi:hypothetical protein